MVIVFLFATTIVALFPIKGGTMSDLGIDNKSILGIDYTYRQNIDLSERLAFLQDAISIGKGEVIVGQIIFDFLDYAEAQCYLDENGTFYLFPEYEEEKIAHCELKEKMNYYYYCLQLQFKINPFEVYDYLENWIEYNMKSIKCAQCDSESA